MELRTASNDLQNTLYDDALPFIEANTLPISLEEINNQHIIPVFTKDNQALISQNEFIQLTQDTLKSAYKSELLGPYIRVSHPVKGRIPSARHKKAHELLPEEETLFYERMMFVFMVPSIMKEIDGQELKLIIGGVKAYNNDNLNKNGNALQQFSFFIGFKVKVCSNLCIWTDGVKSDIYVNSLDALQHAIVNICSSYNPEVHLVALESLRRHYITVEQFAHLLGKCKLYHHLPKHEKASQIPCGLNDTQLNYITRSFYQDPSFGSRNGKIDLWSLYNICTGALKSSYIDTFVVNNIQLSAFFRSLSVAIQNGEKNWYLI
jgi:hypothetical protein